MLTWVAKKLFGTSNERAVRRMRPMVVLDQRRWRRASRSSPTPSSRPRPPSSRRSSTTARRSTTSWSRPSPCAAKAGRRALNMRHYDVQLIGGMVLHHGKHRRDEDRRGQDAGRDAAHLSQRARGQGRAPRHGERLPRHARRGVDGAALQLPRPVHRRGDSAAKRRRTRSTPTSATSATGRTTSSASTTCATT